MRFGWASLAAAALLLAACGGNDSASGDDDARVAEAAAFMAENADADGVVTLESGLQYKVLTAAPDGAPSPDGNDLVRVHYEGSLIDGTVFDSSFERGSPYVTTPEQVVPGWTEALQRMKVGDEWLLYVPPELGYGGRRSGQIPPHSVLVFRIQLLDMAAAPGGGGSGRG
ncbi:FKBP-type peptidyl-prolyl cis-trans isomerase [Brevundimonas sp. BAL450]|jgi:FKBP-type peptidyl-prolyl cis-trans isomerase FklB|uniref:Peptidyl-prolyl cis-trans isomerase n=1 Tax=Brevundimonas abyssalis TAR-001 TaxID=1391729 RepID=A0A8E0NBV1_9CAUL|nr:MULTISPECIES: FKBP-type peptidyl-prolyl cis-trans isomerase [Brevundimonas]MBG7614198.1 FKBP-type peptidyl-prolyl cis-trans isomerase [Brevundimonas sp. BAL450]GAD59490.1 FKBP-type peptidyl-prolyl cis-trans isomerase FklB [Brevundimonas abyssalis TAR-001]